MAISLTPEEEAEYLEGFKLFDKKNQGSIEKADLGTVMRSLGLNPSNAEIVELQKECAKDTTIDFSEFKEMVIKQKKNEGGEEEIKESFKIFDKNGTGVISVEELKHILTTIGEKLTEEEFNEMMKEAEIDQNKNINCADFVKMLLAK